MKIVLLMIASLLMISCVEGTKELGNEYIMEYGPGGPYKWILSPENSVIVNEHVLDFAFDSVYIIAVQRPFDSVPECNQEGKKYSDCKRAMLKTSTFRQYWIIDKTKESVFVTEDRKHTNAHGPFNEGQYLLMRKELNIPDSLWVELD